MLLNTYLKNSNENKRMNMSQTISIPYDIFSTHIIEHLNINSKMKLSK